MKIGFRKPSLKKSLRARTTGKWKRQAKKTIIPGYGKKDLAGLKILKKRPTIRFIIEQHLAYLIF